MTDEEKKPRYNPAKGNMWYEFMQATIALDNNPEDKKPRGYHWFWGLYFIKDKLPDFDLTEIKEELPNEHWLKEAQIPSLSKDLDDLTQKLIKGREYILEEIKIIQEIDKINFEGLDFQDHNTTTTLDFEKTGDFSEFIFPIKTSFDRSRLFPAKFENAIFFNSVSFISVEFCGQALFENTVFCKKADFIIVKFLGEAKFSNANFFDDVSFNGTIFSGSALFSNVKFRGFVTDFSSVTFSNIAIFSHTYFYNFTSFQNTQFLKYTTFNKTNFKIYAPRFYGAKFNNEMTWAGIKLPDFKKANDKETDTQYEDRIEENQNAYENLSTKLGNQKKYRDEHFFFRQEMRCQRKLAESRTSSLAFWLYELFSDYGYRIGRAVWCWAGHIVIGALILFSIRSVDRWNMSWEDFGCSLGISLSNSHAFFFNGDRLEKCYKAFESLPWFNVIWGIQTILGIIFLFLVLLTLRIRFRLK